MDDRTVKEQVINGVSITLKFLAAFATAGMFWAGLTAIVFPQRMSLDSFLLRPITIGPHSFIIAWPCLIVATGIMIASIDLWVRILPGVLGYSTLGALVMLFTGKYNRLIVPRAMSLFLLLFAAACTALSLTFLDRKLSVMDRICLMAFICCLAIGTSPSISITITFLGIGFATLLVAWIVDRVRD
jgi:hypothetical protein